MSQTQNHLALIAEAAFTNHLLVVPILDNPIGRALVPGSTACPFTRSTAAITSRRVATSRIGANDDKRSFSRSSTT